MTGLEFIQFAGASLTTPPIQAVPSLEIHGRDWRVNGTYAVLNIESCLSLPVHYVHGSRDHAKALLTDIQQHGGQMVRVFCGAIPWARLNGQTVGYTAAQVRAILPLLLEDAAALGLCVQAVAITDVEREDHVRQVAEILRGRKGVVYELANEYWQRGVSQAQLVQWGNAHCAGLLWAIGAPQDDEPDPSCVWAGSGGPFGVAHLERHASGPEFWNEILHLRDMYGIEECTGDPVNDNERTGAAEPGTPGQRHFDPAWFFVAGVVDRCFGLSHCFHSEAGRWAELLGSNQRTCRHAERDGHTLVESVLGTSGAPRYYNTGHSGSPVGSIPADQWNDTLGRTEGRCHSFTVGDRGVTYVAGLPAGKDFPVPWQNGWRMVRLLEERAAQHDGSRILVYEIAR